MFTFKRLNATMSAGRRPVSRTTPVEDDLLLGVLPFTDQIRRFRMGGLALNERAPEQMGYDEDDTTIVDPSAQFGTDRFERAEGLREILSDRMKSQKQAALEHADA